MQGSTWSFHPTGSLSGLNICRTVFSEVHRILRPGGHYVFYDIHPFQRPWKGHITPIEVAKPYWETGPFEYEEEGTFEFHWTLADILNSLAPSGFILRRVLESPAEDSRFWQNYSYLPGTDDSLLDWKENPRAALPVWLALACTESRRSERCSAWGRVPWHKQD